MHACSYRQTYVILLLLLFFRDSISVEWQFKDRKFRLVDTAGLTRLRLSKTRLANDDKMLKATEAVARETVTLPGTHVRDDSVFVCMLYCMDDDYNAVDDAVKF